MGHPHLHTKPSLYDCRKVQRFQIFKQNWIISILSSVIAFFVIWAPPALGEGAGGGGYLGA